jgi:hypothetical protein
MKTKQLFTKWVIPFQIVITTFSILGDSTSIAQQRYFREEIKWVLYESLKDSVKARKLSDSINNIIDKNQMDENYLFKLIGQTARKNNGKINNKYSYEWKIRGKRILNQKDKIYLKPIPDQIDTVFYRHPADKVWDFFLCRISVPGTYESSVNPCCGDFIFKSTDKKPAIEAEVIFEIMNSNGKLYLGRIEDKGAILCDSTKLIKPCMFDWSAMYTRYTMVSIEEVDTMDIRDNCRHIEGYDGTSPSDYRVGNVIDPFAVTDCCVQRQVMCFEIKGTKVNSGTYNYCSKKRIVGFRFNWLDDKPLIVRFDAKSNKVYLK